MSSQNPIPARGVMPGRILKRELEARGWTQKDLAEIMGRPPQVLSEIINGTKQITPETALELEQAFGIGADFWMNLEARYQLWLASRGNAQVKSQRIARKSLLYTVAPIRELTKRGWIRPAKSADELEAEVCGFLGISSPHDVPALQIKYQARQGSTPEASAQLAWVRRVEALAGTQKVAEFDAGRFEAAIPGILAWSLRAEDVARLPTVLCELGIHFILVPHLQRTYLDGAAFYLEDRPVVALTLRHDRIDGFWFTLMHELAHIAKRHAAVYFDTVDPKSPSSDDLEVEADRQARDWLLEPASFEAFVRRTAPYFSRQAIASFAAAQRRHPGIVLGRLQYEGHVGYECLRPLLVKVSPFLKDYVDVAAAC